MFYQTIVIIFVITISYISSASADVYFDNGNLVVTPSSSASNDDDDKPVRRSRQKKSTKTYKKTAPPLKTISSLKPASRSHLIRWKGHRMPATVAEKLMEVERLFGPVTIISSCRPGATVKNSGRPSMHSYCRAIDFNPSKGRYSQVANFLKSTWSGGVGTYSGRFNHIHIDDNRGRWHN